MTDAPRRVLYIDDDAGIRRLVQRDFERHGYAVTPAADGTEGLRLAAAEPFDAICLDHFMPGQDGLETLAALRALPEPPPVIYVTGSEEGRIAVSALRAGSADYVIKEAGGDFLMLLRAAVADAIEREALRRAKEAAEREVREARDRAEELARQRAMLLREVNHRVANSLQLIASLTRLQENTLTDPAARGALAEMRSRVAAVAQVHRRLYTSDDVNNVALDDYLAGLVGELERSMALTPQGCGISLDAEPLSVPTDKAVSLGVIVAELVTNAVKYAYPEGGGPIRIRLRAPRGSAPGGEPASRAGDATLTVEDDGIGSGGAGPTRGTGLGRRVVEALAGSLGGRVEAQERSRGTAIVVSFPAGE
ncbi:response regulator [Roseomonas sp. NAR14]|uniref:histidine kinase n=1 Tax=Roseomonas acroporae TaxID=2937791 RepID=A0A9X1Y875_9PROT|nr:histidine kinase dimerization/phosphoacceptor domain -containing protein [Roseomonas acroporae]MCK8784025.1 response regulator [Roseomonas acroporae]